MQTKLVKMGNSFGVRIPKAFRLEAELGDDVEIKQEGRVIIISAVENPREGWAESISADDAQEEAFMWADFVETDNLDWWTWPDTDVKS